MNETKAIQTKQENALIGDSEELKQLGHVIRTLLPGGDKLTQNQAIAVGQVSKLTGANPFRGEIYGYQDKDGVLKLVEGYKLLIRWAERISKFDDTYEALGQGEEGTEPGDVAYRCRLLRYDQRSQIQFYVSLGATFKEAFQMVAKSAVGVVRQNETYSKKWSRPIPAPSGWTWDEVARKRALKNALNRAYGMPSMEELSSDAWRVRDTETTADDWQNADIYKTAEERERQAEVSAWDRETGERFDDLPLEEKRQKFSANVQAMRGPDDEPGIGDEPEAVEDGEFSETTEAEFPVDDPDFPVDPETGEWNEELATAGDVEQPETIVYDGPTSPREFTALVNEERERQKMKPFEELKDLSSFLKTRDLANGGAWPKTPEGWGKAWQAATAKE